MAEHIFFPFFKVGLWCVIPIIVMRLLTPILQKRYAAKWIYLIWLAFIFRLLLPIQSPSLVPSSGVWVPAAVSPISRHPQLPAVLTVLWLAGAGFGLVFTFRSQQRFIKRVRRYGREAGGQCAAALQEVENALGFQGNLKLCIFPEAEGPALTGVFHPILLLPHEHYPETDLKLILAHELTHARRRDVFVKYLLLLCRCVHWWNPFVYTMCRWCCEAMENACDEEVICLLGASYRKPYCNAILNAMCFDKHYRFMPAAGFTGTPKRLQQRFARIFEPSAKKKGTAALTAALVLLASFGAASERRPEMGAPWDAAAPAEVTTVIAAEENGGVYVQPETAALPWRQTTG